MLLEEVGTRDVHAIISSYDTFTVTLHLLYSTVCVKLIFVRMKSTNLFFYWLKEKVPAQEEEGREKT